MFEVPYVGADMQSMNEWLPSNRRTFLSVASSAGFFPQTIPGILSERTVPHDHTHTHTRM